jgi:hypothetical protein
MSGENHQIADQGDTVRLTATFTNFAGALTNPTTVTFVQRTPTQTVGQATSTTSGNTNTSTGVYIRDVPLTAAGLWQFELRGAGNNVDQVIRYAVDVLPRAAGAS